MDKDEVIPVKKAPCDICKNLTFNRPNWDGSVTCSALCTDAWIRNILGGEQDKWDELRDEIRSEIAAIRAQSGANGSH